ncbi:MAG: hypothetical protein ACRD21_09830 [Vicinamibacteria bacterium]
MIAAMKAAFVGFGRVVSSPSLVFWLWVANVAAAFPLTLMLSRSLEESIGGSLVHERLESGFDMGWYGEFQADARGFEESFSPSIVGAGAFFDNLEGWFNGGLFEASPGLVGAGVLYALLWALFLGGIFHRYGSGTGFFRLSELLSRGGEFFFRFARLAVLSGFLYYLVYRLSVWLFGRVEDATRDVTMERTVLGYVVAAALLVAFLLTFIHVAFDYAKIATFKENRRSMLLAMVKGFRLVLGNLGRTMILYYGLALFGLLLLGAYYLIAPGPGQSSLPSVVFAFLVGQAYLIVKLVLRLTFYAGGLALYDSSGCRC